MLTILSPSKKLDEHLPSSYTHFTLPVLLADSQKLIKICRQLSLQQLAQLMKISDTLAAINLHRFACWQPDFNQHNAKQAIFMFKGDVYTGLDADSFSATTLNYSQQHLRILSGLYGILRPLDLIQAYRLEMGIKLVNPLGADLYDFWGEKITQLLNKALDEQHDNILINLASDEYYHVVQPEKINGMIIKPIFLDKKNGVYKTISFYAKKARGLMARFIMQHQINDINALMTFDSAGYQFCIKESTPTTLIFKRG